MSSVFLAVVSVLSLSLAAQQPEQPREVPGGPTPPPVAPEANLPSTRATDTAVTTRWKGAITLPGGAGKLEFSLTVRDWKDGSPPTGTVSIPVQNFRDGPTKDLRISDSAINFTLPIPGAPEAAWPVFELAVATTGTSAQGTMIQGGQKCGVIIDKVAADADLGPNRPQTPKGPFPYTQREVTIKTADSASLAGTLTIPAGKPEQKHPAVMLLTGSGPQDRDETLFDHKPFAVIADFLTRRGIAVLRCDDRNVGGSFSPVKGSETTLDFANDAVEGVKFLAQQPEIDATKIGLLGHSEGGIVGPLAATMCKDVAFLVLLAGTGVPGNEILERQTGDLMRVAGESNEAIEAAVAGEKKLLDLLIALDGEKAIPEAKLAELRAAARALIVTQLSSGGDESALSAEQKAAIDPVIKQTMNQMLSPWMRRFVTLDPRIALRKVTVPVLAINGSLDRQVRPEPNLPEIAKALREAGNKDVTTKTFKGLNHLFQEARSGGIDEYATIETTIEPEVLETITKWIAERTGLAAKTKTVGQ